MNIKQIKRMQNVHLSGIRMVFEKVSRLEQQGKDIIHMEIGRPDFDTPIPIKAATKQALDDGFVHYTESAGILELREALSKKLRKDNRIDLNPEEIIITAGASEAIFICIMAFLEPNDQVLIPDPMYVYYQDWPEFAGATTVPVPLKEDFQLDLAAIKQAITDRTKMIILNTPHNPTGSVIKEEILSELGSLVRRHDLLVLSDEIYELLTYDNAKHVSIGSLPGMKERTLTVNSFSKTYSMTGWRLGYVAAPKKLIEPLLKTRQHTSNCPCSFVQKGALIAINKCQSHVKEMVKEFDRRRKLVIERLREIDEFEFVEPKGAFYVFPSTEKLGMDGKQLASYLLEEAGVATVPGEAFGKSGKDHIRIAYSTGYEELEEGLDRISKSLQRL